MIAPMRTLLCCALLALTPVAGRGAESARHVLDLPYAAAAGAPLRLDLHLPAAQTPAPLVVYVHGGAWSAGDKRAYPAFLVEQGFAVASVDFRPTTLAPFPANVHDIKAALRYLRAMAVRHGYDASRVAITGASSGGHLAALVGVSAGQPALEGSLGEHLDQSSAVQAIVSWFGASNLTTILAQSTPHGLAVRVPALQRLLGGLPDQAPSYDGLARLASPVFHVGPDAPPLLLLHGDQDPQMPINQMHELQGAYERAGRPVQTLVLHGVGHDAAPFFGGEPARKVVEFLRQALGS